MTFTAVACQSFAGGLDLGMSRAGARLIHKTEQKGGFGSPNVLVNRKLIGDGNWTYEDGDWTKFETPPADVVYGCPPCSGFSLLSNRNFRGVDSTINSCMNVLVAVAAGSRPKAVVMESVQAAFWTGRPLMLQLRDQFEAATGLEGRVYLNHVLHNAHNVGSTAERRRYFMVLTVDRPLSVNGYPNAAFSVRQTLRDAIGDLHDQPLSNSPQDYVALATSKYQMIAREASVTVDGHDYHHSPGNKRVVAALQNIDWKEGERMSLAVTRYYDANGEMFDSWKYQEDHLVRRREEKGVAEFPMGFNQPCRWAYDKNSHVITGGATHIALHPEHHRPLTYRELARIMGYPDTWVIEPNLNTVGMRAWWGKQVTVECGQWIGTQVGDWLDEKTGSDLGTPVGEREVAFQHTAQPPRPFEMKKFILNFS